MNVNTYAELPTFIPRLRRYPGQIICLIGAWHRTGGFSQEKNRRRVRFPRLNRHRI